MSLITTISNKFSYLLTSTLAELTNIVDARFRGDTEATKANKEYHYNNIAAYLKALGWAVHAKNTLFVRTDAPVDFNGSDNTIFNTAQLALDAIPTTGVNVPAANNLYVIIGDPLTDFLTLDWTAHTALRTFITVITFNSMAQIFHGVALPVFSANLYPVTVQFLDTALGKFYISDGTQWLEK